MNKTRMLSFRVQESEEQAINDYLEDHGIKRSPFIRDAVFAYINSDKPQLRRDMLAEFKDMRREFTNAGNNINQVAYRLNAGHPVSTDQLRQAQEDLQQAFAQVVFFFKRIQDELRR